MHERHPGGSRLTEPSARGTALRPGGSPDLLIFLHIPRTGGTTLTRILTQNYPPAATFGFVGADMDGSIERYRALGERGRASLRLINGHVPFGLHEIVGAAGYVTMLRDPVERVVSIFEFIVRRPAHPLHEQVRTMTLPKFLDSELYTQSSDGQCKLLTGVGIDDGNASGDEQMLEAAWENLRSRFVAVGLTERYDESLVLYRHRLGWKRLAYVPENTLKGRTATERLEEPVLEAIRRRNRFDIELYRRAEVLFEQHLGEVPDRERQLEGLRRSNTLQRPWRALRAGLGRRWHGLRELAPDPAKERSSR